MDMRTLRRRTTDFAVESFRRPKIRKWRPDERPGRQSFASRPCKCRRAFDTSPGKRISRKAKRRTHKTQIGQFWATTRLVTCRLPAASRGVQLFAYLYLR